MKISLLLILLAISMTIPQNSMALEEDDMTEYRLDIVVDTDNYSISGKEVIRYYNQGADEIDEVYFYLYANAFRDTFDLPVDDILKSYPSGFDPGYINVTVRDHEYSIEDEIFLKVILDNPLESGDYETIILDLDIKIPETLNRFGHYENIIYAANCFPIACVNLPGGWALYPFTSIGDPFFSETADWEVELMLKREWDVACSGHISKKYENGEYYEYLIEAPLSRDFAFVCSDDFSMVRAEHGDVLVSSYFTSGHRSAGSEVLEYAIEALTLYEEIYGDYPYDSYTLVETHLGVGAGMEYPQLIFIDSDYYEGYGDPFDLEIIVAHETAHQWWYSVVGNDEFMDSFIDESLAQYSTAIYLDWRYLDGWEGFFQGYLLELYKQNYAGLDNILDLPLNEYASGMEYYMMVYIKGPIIMDMLATCMGEDEYLSFLSDIYYKYQYGIISKDILREELEDAYPDTGLDQIFETLVSTSTMPDAAPGYSTREDGQYNIIILYSNMLEIPVEVQLSFADGSSQIVGPLTSFSIESEKEIMNYIIDPNDLLIESNEGNNTGEIVLVEIEEDDKCITPYLYLSAAAAAILIIGFYIYKKMSR